MHPNAERDRRHRVDLGGRVVAVDVNPLGTRLTELVMVELIALGHLAGALVLAGRADRGRARVPAAVMLALSSTAAVLVVLSG